MFRQFVITVKRDFAANRRDPKARAVLLALRIAQAWAGVETTPRLSSWPAVAAYRLWTEWLLGMEIRPKTRIGPGLTIHHGFGIVINDHSEIGTDVVIRNGVTIGHTLPGGGCPKIGDGVSIGAGAIILGDVTIGERAVVGAGAVVTKDVQAYSVVVGNPAHLIAPQLTPE